MHRLTAPVLTLAAALLAGCQTPSTDSSSAWTTDTSLASFDSAAAQIELSSDAVRLAQVAFGRPGELSLGAGDALGRMIYLNDLVLARRMGIDHPGLWIAAVPE